MQPTVLPVLGTRIASVTYDEAVEIILRRARAEQPNAYICAANVHTVSLARRDPLYRGALNGALLAVPDGAPLVWARRDVSLRTCPKSYITAESQTLVEDFFVRRSLRGMDFAELSARQVEAFVILERAFAAGINNGQHNTR